MCQLASGPRKTTRSCRALYHHNPGPMLLPIGQAPVTQERTRQHSAFGRHCAAVRDWQHCASVAKDRPEQVDGRAGVARSSLVGSVDLFSESFHTDCRAPIAQQLGPRAICGRRDVHRQTRRRMVTRSPLRQLLWMIVRHRPIPVPDPGPV
jgi:hypothetical protein